MIVFDRLKLRFPAAAGAVVLRVAVIRKAVSFALVGVVNTLVDAGVFFLTYANLRSHPAPMQLFDTVAAACGCGTTATITLIAANVFSWFIAVSGSYAMNSYITFAAESGRKLTLRAWSRFLASGILGAIANTTTLVVIAQFLPVWAAKGCAILVSFAVNFSLSHFVVFRRREANNPL